MPYFKKFLVGAFILTVLMTWPHRVGAEKIGTRAVAQAKKAKPGAQASKPTKPKPTKPKPTKPKPTKPKPTNLKPSTPEPRPQPVPPAGGEAIGWEDEVLILTNQYRAQFGLHPLTWNNALGRAAQAHSEMMSGYLAMEHELNGTTPEQRIRNAGYSYARYGENIAMGSGEFASPLATVVRWIESPGHRENLVDPDFTELGVGVRQDPYGFGLIYYTQVFGRPKK